MNIRTQTAAAALLLALASAPAAAEQYMAAGAEQRMPAGTEQRMPAGTEQRMLAGTESGDRLAANGLAETVTAPGRVIEEIGKDTSNFGVGGVVTGGVRGGVKGAGQVLTGAARMTIGILDVLTSPFREPEPIE